MSQYPDPCPHTGRRRITVAQWANRPDELVDDYAFFFDPEAEEKGRASWAFVEEVELRVSDGRFDVCMEYGLFRTVPADWPLYVSADSYGAFQCGS